MNITADLAVLIAIDIFLYFGSQIKTTGRGFPFPPLLWIGGSIYLLLRAGWTIGGRPVQSLAELGKAVSPDLFTLFWYLFLAECAMFVAYRIHPIKSKRYRVTVTGSSGGMLGRFEYVKSFRTIEEAQGYRDQMYGDKTVSEARVEDTGKE